MNKIDIILIYLIIIISFVCIIKIYLNNKNIERFYSFNREFSGVMRFIDKNDDHITYLGSYPNTWEGCFINNDCEIAGIKYKYDSHRKKIIKKNGNVLSDDQDEMIDVTDIRLPKGDKGDDGSDAIQPTIQFYYKNTNGQNINELENGDTEVVTPGIVHGHFYKSIGSDQIINVYVTRHDNCTPSVCDQCTGDVSINNIKATENGTAVTVNGNITTNNIILQPYGKICIDNEEDGNCLTYNNIRKLINWNQELSD